MHEYPYPYDQPTWNVSDQKYWNKMVGTYRYPVAKVRDPFRYIIEAGKQLTFEAEYQQYLSEQAAISSEPI